MYASAAQWQQHYPPQQQTALAMSTHSIQECFSSSPLAFSCVMLKKLTKKFVLSLLASQVAPKHANSDSKIATRRMEQQQQPSPSLHSPLTDLMWKICFNFMTFSLTHPDSGGSLDTSELFTSAFRERFFVTRWMNDLLLDCDTKLNSFRAVDRLMASTGNFASASIDVSGRVDSKPCGINWSEDKSRRRRRRWRRSPWTNRSLSCYHTENEPHDSMPPTPEKNIKRTYEAVCDAVCCCSICTTMLLLQKVKEKNSLKKSINKHPSRSNQRWNGISSRTSTERKTF